MFIFKPLNQYKMIAKTRCKNIIAANCFKNNELNENEELKNVFWARTKWSNTIFKSHDFIQFKKEFIDANLTPNHSFYRNAEANFAVDKRKILARDILYYKKIFSSLNNIAPIEGHYLERLWDEVFREN